MKGTIDMLSIPERKAQGRSGSRMMHGGYTGARPLSPIERLIFNALIDTLVPPEDGWPPAAELTLADLALRYLVPDDAELSFYPHFRHGEFFAVLDERAPGLEELDEHDRVVLLTEFELTTPELFARVRDFAYYVYYGHPDVVELIRQRTAYGKDFHGRPQPIGYDAVLENWGSRPLVTRGTFFTTDSVRRAPQAPLLPHPAEGHDTRKVSA